MELLEDESSGHGPSYKITDKLKTDKYSTESKLVRHWPNGKGFSVKWLIENGFSQPMVFHSMDGLDMKVPSDKFTVEDVKSLVGPNRHVDVVDCDTQEPLVLSLQQFVNYYLNKTRRRKWAGKRLNVISLEFSHTRMDPLVEPPHVVRDLDWVNWVWPSELKQSQTDSTNDMRKMMYPKVQKYCLMSVSDCYTDFHLDFGGTSVWYHILHGEKVFVLVPPSKKNYDLFLEWQRLGQQTSVFFADNVAECAVVRLRAGDTLFLPSGWIHSVYTPKNSLVFGGNFLHSLNIQQQLLVAETERKLRVPKQFLYPFYGQIHWYLVERYLALLGPLCAACLEVTIDNGDIWRAKFCRKRWLKSVRMTKVASIADRKSHRAVNQEPVESEKPVVNHQTQHHVHAVNFCEVEKSGVLFMLSRMLAQDTFIRDVPVGITNPTQMVSDLQRIMLCPHLTAPVEERKSVGTAKGEGSEGQQETGAVLFNGVGNTHSCSLSAGIAEHDALGEDQYSGAGKEALPERALSTEQPKATSILPKSVDVNAMSPHTPAPAEVDQLSNLSPSVSESVPKDHSSMKAASPDPSDVVVSTSLTTSPSAGVSFLTGPLLATSPVLLSEHYFRMPSTSVPSDPKSLPRVSSPVTSTSNVRAEDGEPAAKRLQTHPIGTAGVRKAPTTVVSLPFIVLRPDNGSKDKEPAPERPQTSPVRMADVKTAPSRIVSPPSVTPRSDASAKDGVSAIRSPPSSLVDMESTKSSPAAMPKSNASAKGGGECAVQRPPSSLVDMEGMETSPAPLSSLSAMPKSDASAKDDVSTIQRPPSSLVGMETMDTSPAPVSSPSAVPESHDVSKDGTSADKSLRSSPSRKRSAKTASAADLPLPAIDKKKLVLSRKRRCGTCQGCTSDSCGVCRYCLDNPKLGGSGKLKQACIQRRCLNLKKRNTRPSSLSQVHKTDVHPADSTTSPPPLSSNKSPFPVPLSQVGALPYVLMTVPEAYVIGNQELASFRPAVDPREERSPRPDEPQEGPNSTSGVIDHAESLEKGKSIVQEELSVDTTSKSPTEEAVLGESDNLGSDPLISEATRPSSSSSPQPAAISNLCLTPDAMDALPSKPPMSIISPPTTEVLTSMNVISPPTTQVATSTNVTLPRAAQALSSSPAMISTSLALNFSDDDCLQKCIAPNLV